MNKLKKNLEDKIEILRKDVLMFHLERVKVSVERKYVDENQAMVLVDHLMRMRILQEVVKDLEKLESE